MTLSSKLDRFTVFIVDDDPGMRDSLWAMLRARGIDAEVYVSGEDFLNSCRLDRPGVLLLDMRMPGLSGLDIIEVMEERGVELPFIVMTGHGDVPLAVKAMKAGAFDFIEKPFNTDQLVSHIEQARAQAELSSEERSKRQQAKARVARLTNREREVLTCLVAGQQTKRIAADLGLSVRTVEVHRSNIIKKFEVDNVAGAVRTAVEAGVGAASSA